MVARPAAAGRARRWDRAQRRAGRRARSCGPRGSPRPGERRARAGCPGARSGPREAAGEAAGIEGEKQGGRGPDGGRVPLWGLLPRELGGDGQQAERRPGACAPHGRCGRSGLAPAPARTPVRTHPGSRLGTHWPAPAPPARSLSYARARTGTHARGSPGSRVCTAGGARALLKAVTAQPDLTLNFP